ncbi:MAG: hypothetical protein ACKVS9_07160 [Phycisphaerae bacterium]
MAVEMPTWQQRALRTQRRTLVVVLGLSVASLGLSIERKFNATGAAARMAAIMASALQQEASTSASLRLHGLETSAEARLYQLSPPNYDESRLRQLTERGVVRADAYSAAKSNKDRLQSHIDRNLAEQLAWGIAAGLSLALAVYCGVRILILTRRIAVTHPQCLPCGYNLTGNESGTCPECGTRFDP